MKHVPAWFPGAEFQRIAARSRIKSAQMLNAPLKVVKEALGEGRDVRCAAAEMLMETTDSETREDEEGKQEEEDIRRVTGTAYIGEKPTSLVEYEAT